MTGSNLDSATPSCVSVDELGALRESTSDPRWTHVETCARCRALWLEYAAFLDGTPAPGAQPEAAAESLRAALEATLRSADIDPVAAGGARARPAWRRFLDAMLPRRAWMVPAAAAVVVLLLIYAPGLERAERSGVLRGESADVVAASVYTVPGDAGAPDVLRFTWEQVAGADAYEIVIFSAALDEIARFAAGAGTSFDLPLDSNMPAGAVLWRVQSYRVGDPFRHSRVSPFPELP